MQTKPCGFLILSHLSIVYLRNVCAPVCVRIAVGAWYINERALSHADNAEMGLLHGFCMITRSVLLHLLATTWKLPNGLRLL